MLDIRRIREDSAAVSAGLAAKGADTRALDKVLELDKTRRSLLTETETLKSRRNKVSKDIGALKKQGKDTSSTQTEMREVGEQIAALDERVRHTDEQLEALMLSIPNIPHPDAPRGTSEADNRLVKEVGKPRTFDFEPKTHVELGEQLGVIDFARGTKMTGSGFPILTGQGARLERALINFMLDIHTGEHGYREIWPPVLCNTAAMTGTGQLPKMEDDMYKLEADGLYMAPTAEVPVTNYFREEILEDPLPIYLTAYTACFRREAGAAGKETRGLIRVHQFDKVEMVKFVEPSSSYEELEKLLADAEDVLNRLGLTYRVIELCGGDLSFAAAKCYDIELWAPGQREWLEVSSCSNFEDFQARRAGIRYRNESGKTAFVHTLNGSGVALPRLVVAILENGQQADGSVILPEAIAPYMGNTNRIAND